MCFTLILLISSDISRRYYQAGLVDLKIETVESDGIMYAHTSRNASVRTIVDWSIVDSRSGPGPASTWKLGEACVGQCGVYFALFAVIPEP